MKYERSHWIVRLLLVFVVVVLLSVLSQTKPIKSIVTSWFGQINKPMTIIGTDLDETGEIFFESREELIEKLIKREDQIKSLAIVASSLEDAKVSLEQAYELLEYKKTVKIPINVGKVLVRTKESSDTYLIIDIGEKNGVKLNDPVVSNKGIFIGSINEVNSTTSRVDLITNSSSVVGGSILSTGETTGIISGGHGAIIEMDFVPRTLNPNQNDTVITSGIDPKIPRGLVIGLINNIHDEEHSPFYKIDIEPLTNTEDIRLVGVMNIDGI